MHVGVETCSGHGIGKTAPPQHTGGEIVGAREMADPAMTERHQMLDRKVHPAEIVAGHR